MLLYSENFGHLTSLEPLVAAERAQGIPPECGSMQALFAALGDYIISLGWEELNIKRRMRECQPLLSPTRHGMPALVVCAARPVHGERTPPVCCRPLCRSQALCKLEPQHTRSQTCLNPPRHCRQVRTELKSACATRIVHAAMLVPSIAPLAGNHAKAGRQQHACSRQAGEQAALPHVMPRAPVRPLLTQTSWLNCTLR